ncbi:MAG: hypothetical protein IH612_11300 [Desulfofustis sp.]|nr:hypothetical protein [Desulfofustis sp.]
MRVTIAGCCLIITAAVVTLFLPPPTGAAVVPEHQAITSWQGAATCLQCHENEAKQVFDSVHYQWLGEATEMVNGPDIQGKLDMGVNSYCINTTGNWNGCGACHVGYGARPEVQQSQAQLENIDCLICHQQEYKRVKVDGVFVPDTAQMTISMVAAAQTVHLPTRETCLQCHAKGGGGDNYKRGDMALSHSNTTDRDFDVHMAVTGGDLSCQSCHVTQEHRMAGRGSDLRTTDLNVEMSCATCHTDKDTPTGHEDQAIGRHVARVSCQTCHIPAYARNASDTVASDMTEVHRDWREPHPTTPSGPPIHPTVTMAGDLNPRYAWWNGTSSSYLLHDTVTVDPDTGMIPTSRPVGRINEAGAKLYPFKYKTATQPVATGRNQLIALDTSVYFATGDADAATRAGLVNMGYQPEEPYSWAHSDTMQLLSHEIAPSADALSCNACHENTGTMDLKGELGYQLKAPVEEVCLQCHGQKGDGYRTDLLWVHDKHVRSKRYDCSWCHDFSRPERGLKLAPIIAQLSDVVSTLKILAGQTLSSPPTIQDANGDGRIGLAEVIATLRDAAGL